MYRRSSVLKILYLKVVRTFLKTGVCLLKVVVILFQIRVGVTFMRNTTLQLRNPKNIAQAGSYTKLSIFFKTAERNGFLAYIGPDRNSERKQTVRNQFDIV